MVDDVPVVSRRTAKERKWKRPAGAPVLSAFRWRNNGQLVAHMAALGHLRADRLTLDPTFGRGLWWTEWNPHRLVAHDAKKDGTDFRRLDYASGFFEQIVFDPPYVPMGGVETSTLADYNERFGRDTAPDSPEGVQQLIDDGVDEMYRLIRPGGIVVVKCQNYVWSGHLYLGAHHTLVHALDVGFTVEDWFTHVGHVRAQPGNRTRKGARGERVPTVQAHSRQNASVAYVLRCPRRKPEPSLF